MLEISKDALQYYSVGKTISQTVAEENNLEYIFADPGFQERNSLGIKSRQEVGKSIGIYFDSSTIGTLTKQEQEKINIANKDNDTLREKEWLRRIEKNINKPIIFMCGFEHADTFYKLIEQSGYKASIYCKYK